jgi:hypothetical protein
MSKYYPIFFQCYLDGYVKIALDSYIYKHSKIYSGLFFENPNFPQIGDYVASKDTCQKIYKISEIFNHEVTLIDFDLMPIYKETFEKNIKIEKSIQEYYLNEGGNYHMKGSIYELYNKGYGKNIKPMTIEEINNERTIINEIRKNNIIE